MSALATHEAAMRASAAGLLQERGKPESQSQSSPPPFDATGARQLWDFPIIAAAPPSGAPPFRRLERRKPSPVAPWA